MTVTVFTTPLVPAEVSLNALYTPVEADDPMGATYVVEVAVGFPDRHFWREYVVTHAVSASVAEAAALQKAALDYPGCAFLSGPASPCTNWEGE